MAELTPERLAEIEAREKAAIPGPWGWRGNLDHGDPHLVSLSGPRWDVMGFIPHEVTYSEADRAGIGALLEVPDEPEDAIKAYLRDDESPYGCRTELRLAFVSDGRYREAGEVAVFEVAPEATTREDQRVYRADIVGLRDPNAEFIAHARQDVADLLAEVRRLRTTVDLLLETPLDVKTAKALIVTLTERVRATESAAGQAALDAWRTQHPEMA